MPHNRKTAQPHVFLPPERSTSASPTPYIIYMQVRVRSCLYAPAALASVTRRQYFVQQMFYL